MIKHITAIALLTSSLGVSAASCPEYLNVEARKLHSKDNVNLCELTQGKPVLIVNTASNCGFTPQFEALEALHKEYADKGLVVIGFPSDDFFQEEKDEANDAKSSKCFVRFVLVFGEHVAEKAAEKETITKAATPSR